MRHVGHYTLLAPLASGDSGAVYFAIKTAHAKGEPNPLCAVKLFDESIDIETIEQIELRIRELSRIQHDAHVPVLDAGVAGEAPHMVTELIHGLPMSTVVQRAVRRQEWVPVEIVLHVAATTSEVLMASALPHASLAPKRLFIAYGGSVKVFGTGLPDLTADTATALPFKAPETLEHGAVNTASEVYALGAILFEALTGRRIFRRASNEETRRAILEGGCPDLTTIRRDIPPRIASLVRAMLARSPAERPSDLSEI